MEVWDLCPHPNHHSLNLECPCHSLDYLNSPLCNGIAGSRESVLIKQPFSVCNEVCMDKDLPWTDQFFAYSYENEVLPKTEALTVNSATVGSSSEEEHSGICVEDQKSELSDRNKTSEGEEIVDRKSKKRKRFPQKEPKYAFKTRSNQDVFEDGYRWRKYGKKTIKSSSYPRNYYRCSASDCGVKKRVERDPNEPTMLIATYEGNHNHESPSLIYYIGNPIVLQQPWLSAGHCAWLFS